MMVSLMFILSKGALRAFNVNRFPSKSIWCTKSPKNVALLV